MENTVYHKLQRARCLLQNKGLKKSGRNTFSKYDYYELKDFLPEINDIFLSVGLCSVVSFTNEMATMEIIDVTKTEDKIIFTSPMKELDLKGANAIQSLGGVETYQRRYLYMTALEIVENDTFDSGEIEPQDTKKPPAIKYIGKAEMDKLKAIDLLDEVKGEIVRGFGFGSSKEITLDKFPEVLKAFERAEGK